VLDPLVDAAWGYRRKGRFSVRRVEKKDKTLVRLPRAGSALRRRPARMPHRDPADRDEDRSASRADRRHGARRDIPQSSSSQATDTDRTALCSPSGAVVGRANQARCTTSRRHDFAVFLQPGGIDSVHRLWPHQPEARVHAAGVGHRTAVPPLDFIQVNAGLNQR
jgi:23S rRNA (uracil1939-C5)-methyltransferase